MDEELRGEERGEAREERSPGRHRARSFLLFLLVLAAVLGVAVLAAYRDGTGFDALRRYFAYGTAESSGGATDYTYDASPSNRFAALGDSLVVLSDTEVQILDSDGQQIYAASVGGMKSPALAKGGGRVAAYDVGGTELYVLDEKGELAHLSADAQEPYLSVTLNDKGYMAVTAEKKGAKGCVSVYNEHVKKVFEFNSSERFVTTAAVTEDCRRLAAVTLGQEDSVFVSSIVLYDLTKEEPQNSYSVENGLVLAITADSRGITTLSDTCLSVADEDGKLTGGYDYTGEYLRGYDLGGDGFSVLALNRYQSGSAGRLVTVDEAGQELASLDVNEEVLSVSAAGKYIAVLYADRCVICHADLQVYAELSGTDYARAALVRTDGSALLISSERAFLFLP